MSAKENFSKAMFDMFGVGGETAADGVPQTATVETALQAAEVPAETPAAAAYEVPKTAGPKAGHTYLAEDTVLEGTLRTKSDVTIAGTFKGDIFSEGDVTLHTSVTGNMTARSMTLVGCVLTGESVVTETVDIRSGASVNGNIQAGEVLCSGVVEGDITASRSIRLERTAQVRGNITAAALSVEQGAMIHGKLAIS